MLLVFWVLTRAELKGEFAPEEEGRTGGEDNRGSGGGVQSDTDDSGAEKNLI